MIASRSRLAAVLAGVAAALVGCATPLAPSAFERGSPVLRPEVFFAGTTRSTGVLQNAAGAPTRRLRVEGTGARQPDGTFRLDQTVHLEGAAPTTRTWLLRPLDDHRYTATLTDAAGPVEAEAYGDLLHLRYAMTSPPGGAMEQWMYLQPDGRTVLNEATVRVFGFVVARLSERISRDAAAP